MALPNCRDLWPALPLAEWQDTYATLHMCTQAVGKIRLAMTPLQNHFWNSALYLTPRGLTTANMRQSGRELSIDFDFLDHSVVIRSSSGETRALPLFPRTVSDWHAELMATLGSLGFEPHIWTTPCEVPDPVPFERDREHAAYDREYVERFFRVLLSTEAALQRFRSGFIGKCSPVHFFWGSFDLAVSRFSGRRAPERPGADSITREAYSHEVSSVGFWPGGGGVDGAAFYAYAAPEPEGFQTATIRPATAFYHADLHEYILMYDEVRTATDPDQVVLEFAASTYEAAANLGKWDRASLERV